MLFQFPPNPKRQKNASDCSPASSEKKPQKLKPVWQAITTNNYMHETHAQTSTHTHTHNVQTWVYARTLRVKEPRAHGGVWGSVGECEVKKIDESDAADRCVSRVLLCVGVCVGVCTCVCHHTPSATPPTLSATRVHTPDTRTHTPACRQTKSTHPTTLHA
jgi:hypothetical protein